MKPLIILVITLLSIGRLFAQSSEDCNARLANAKRQLEKDSISSAINSLLWVKVCDEALSAEANRLILQAFEKIEGNKKAALLAQNRAEKAEKKAKAELEKSKRLSSFFKFGQEDASWAYNSENGLFAVINKNGEQLTEFRYEAPEKFSKGFAYAKTRDANQTRFVFLNSKGLEISPHFEYLTLAQNNKYLVGFNHQYFGTRAPDKDPLTFDYYHMPIYKNTAIYSVDSESIFGIDIPGRPDGYIKAIYRDSLWGLLDSLGNVVIQPVYSDIGPFSEGFAPVRLGNKFGVVNKKGNLVVPIEFDDIWSYFEGLAPAKLNHKWGYIDYSGNWVIQPRYDEAWSFSNGLANVKQDSLWGFIDKNGSIQIPIQYISCSIFSGGLAPAIKQDKWGYINSEDKVIIDYKFDHAEPFVNGHAQVVLGDTTAIIDLNGQIIASTRDFVHLVVGKNFIVLDTIPDQKYPDGRFHINMLQAPAFEDFEKINDSTLLVLKDSIWINVNLNEPDLFGYEHVKRNPDTKYSIFKTNDGYTMTDGLGNEPYYQEIEIYPRTYNLRFGNWLAIMVDFLAFHIYDYNEFYQNQNLTSFSLNNKYGFIDKVGKVVIPAQFDAIPGFSCNRARVQQGDYFGFLDSTGNWALKPVYTAAEPFVHGKAFVQSDSITLLIDTNGKVLHQFDSLSGLAFPAIIDGLVYVGMPGEKIAALDTNGNWVILPNTGLEFPFTNGLAVASKNDKVGFLDKSAQWRIPADYLSAWPFDNGLALVSTETGNGVIDTLGNIILPPHFQKIEAIYPDQGFAPNEGGIILLGSSHFEHYYHCIDTFEKESVVGVDINNKVHTLSPNEFVIAPFEHTWGGLYLFRNESDLLGILSPKLDTMLPAQYYGITPVGYRIYLLEQNGLFGLFAPDYNVLLPCLYEKIGYAAEENGWVRVQQKGKWGWVACEKDKKGHIQAVTKIPCRFDFATPFRDGRAQVLQLPYTEVFHINTKGEMLLWK